jgi:hypothetical protein
VTGTYTLNTYDQARDENQVIGITQGMKREDEMGKFDIGVNYLFNDLSGVRIGYSFINRDSNVEFYDYDTNRFFIQFGFGWF